MGFMRISRHSDLVLSRILVALAALFANLVVWAADPAGCIAAAPSGLVAWLPGDGDRSDFGSGVSATSAMGNVGFASGLVGQAFSFDGSGALVNLAASADLNLRNAVTIAAWIKPSVSTAGVIGGRPGGYQMQLRNDGRVLIAFPIGGTVNRVLPSTSLIPTNSFTFVAASYDSTTGTIKMYINGVLENSAQTSGLIDSMTKPFQIGGYFDPSLGVFYATPGYGYTGLIDELQVFNRALTATEVQGIYNAGSAGICKSGLASQPTFPGFTEYPLPRAPSGTQPNPNRIAVGGDNNLWFTESDRIGKITTLGSITEYSVPGGALGITQGPDGNMWYASNRCCNSSKVGKISPAGAITEYPAPGVGGGSGITLGSDGNLWFTEAANIGRMTPAGIQSGEFPSQMPSIYSSPNHITAGPDGNVWFTEGTFGGIGRISPAGAVTKFPPLDINNGSTSIVTASDGKLWYTAGDKIVRLSTDGSQTQFGITDSNMTVSELTVGPDGNLWFAGQIYTGSGIGRITPNPNGGLQYDFLLAPTNTAGGDFQRGIVTGPDGNLWFLQYASGKAVRFEPSGPRVTGVSSSFGDAVYGSGAVIPITVTFTRPVIVTGTPKLALNSGGIATYTSGSNTNALTFTYTVASGQSASRLDVSSFMSLAMNLFGATIRDASGNFAVLTLPVAPATGSLGANKQIVISQNGGSTSLFVLAITPNAGGNNGKVTFQITGSGFTTGTVVKLVRAGQPDIIATSTSIGAGGTTLTAIFDLRGAQLGVSDLVVSTPTGSITVSSGFTVEQGRAAEVWVDVIGRSTIRAGTEETFAILYGNRGNVDTAGIPLMIQMSNGLTWRLTSALTPPPAYPGVPPATWTNFPLNYESNGMITVPLLISKIPPGSSGIVILRLTDPTVGSFTLKAWAAPPHFDFLQSRVAGSSCAGAVIQSFSSTVGGGSPLGSSSLLQMDEQIRNAIGLNCGTSSLAAISVTEIVDSEQTTANASLLKGAVVPGVNSKHTSATRSTGECGGWYLPMCCIVQDMKGLVPTANSLPSLGDITSCPVIASSIGCNVPDDDGCHTVFYCGNTNDESSCVPSGSGGGRRTSGAAHDPNDKVGAAGVGASRYFPGDEPLRYAIYFENVATATAAAQQVVISDQLDSTKVDLSTFSLGPIVFGNRQITPPSGLTVFATDVDLRPATNLIVRINASLNSNTGLVTWRFASIDPATGQPTTDPVAGFLPPNTNPPQGEGQVLFTVSPKKGLATGTQVRNLATVVFDANAPLNTPQWLNTIDNSKPVSQVLTLAPAQTSANFTVQWSGSDEGSGVQSYTIYASENGGPFHIWVKDTTALSRMYTGISGSTYAFYSVARDMTGNLEPSKSAAETSTVVNIVKSTPSITWLPPAPVSYGTALSSPQLNATANVPGTFAYTPPAGAVLPAGNNQTLSVTFTPTDTAAYTTATATVAINVNRANASVTPNPAGKIYGQADPNPLTLGTLAGFVPADNVTATYSRTPGETPGTYTISASLSPAATLSNYNVAYNTATFTINTATPVLPPPQTGNTTYGVQTNLSVTVSPVNGGATPTGTVTFQFTDTNNVTRYICANGAVQMQSCSIPLDNAGKASVITANLPVGTDNIAATYSGDANYSSGGQTALNFSVAQANTQTALTITPNNPAPSYGDALTLAVQVTDSTANSVGTPTGTVQFAFSNDNGTTWSNLGNTVTLDAGGKVQLQTTTLPAGAPRVRATYSGDVNFIASSVNVIQNVSPKPLTISG